MGDKYLTFDELRNRGIISNRTTLRRNIQKLGFPPPVQISAKRIAFSERKVTEWLESRTKVPSVETETIS